MDNSPSTTGCRKHQHPHEDCARCLMLQDEADNYEAYVAMGTVQLPS